MCQTSKVLRGLLFMFTILIFYSCQNKAEQMLTAYSWEIEKVVDLKNGISEQTRTNQEKVWDFGKYNTYLYQSKSGDKENVVMGKWNLKDSNLHLTNAFDSTDIIIEEISNKQMIWRINQNDSIKFYLSSKIKERHVSVFPSGNTDL